MDWDGQQEISLDAFPGVTFRWTPEQVEAVTEDETISLYTGMPSGASTLPSSAGDGLPELCSTVSMGLRGHRQPGRGLRLCQGRRLYHRGERRARLHPLPGGRGAGW